MLFIVGQKRHKDSDVTMETRACGLLSSKNDITALVA
jgi:hypothetical protein